MKKLLLKTWRDIWTRKGQFLALILLVAIGIISYVAFVTSYKNLSVSLVEANNELKLSDLRTSLVLGAPKKIVSDIEKVDGVKAVQGRLIFDTGLDLGDNEQAQARIIGVPAENHPKVNDIMVLEGEYLEKGAENEGLLSSKFAAEAENEVGDKLTVNILGIKTKIEVRGIVSNPEYFWGISKRGEIPTQKNFAVIFMEQKQVEKLLKQPPAYNDFSILIKDGANRNEIIKEVEDILEPFQIIETVKKEDIPSNFALREEVEQNKALADSMPSLILIISAVALYIALSRLVQSQRGQIGLAKALGYSNWKILFHYLLFSLFIAVCGSIIGFIFGQLFGRYITQIYVDMLNIPILKHKIHPEVVSGAISLSFFFCILAGIIPAIASARLLPAKAMRFDPSVALSKGKKPIIERIFHKLIPSSFTFRIPLRNVFRAKRRSIYTVLGIAFALILTVTTWAMFDSIDFLIDNQFNKADKYDVFAVFSENFGSEQIEEVKGWEGVEKVQTAMQIPAKIEFDSELHEGAITAVKPSATFHGFRITDGVKPKTALSDDGLILPEGIANKLKAEVGDKIKVKTPYLKKHLSIEVLAISDELWGAPIFISIEKGKELLNTDQTEYNSLYLDVEGSSVKDIKKRLFEQPGAYQVIVKDDLVTLIEDLLSFTYVFGVILFAFAFAMAFVVIYNTFTANVIERSREIATMLTLGEDRMHIGIMITLENLLLAIVGIPFGIYLGTQAASYLYQSISTEFYKFPAVIYPMSYLWITLSILVILLLSEIPPIRRIFKLDLAEATKAVE